MSEYIVRVDGQMPCAIYERELTEIVRCRDCKHATVTVNGYCKYCEMFCLPDTDGYGADPQVYLPGDFFCAWGERRSE